MGSFCQMSTFFSFIVWYEDPRFWKKIRLYLYKKGNEDGGYFQFCPIFIKITEISVQCVLLTDKSLSEALLFTEHGENMLCTKIVLNVRNNFCTQHVLPRLELGIFNFWTCNSMNNLSSYCGIVDAKIRASDKNLHVLALLTSFLRITGCFFVKRFCWITCLVCVVYIKLFWISKQKRLFVKSNPIYNWHSMQTYRT